MGVHKSKRPILAPDVASSEAPALNIVATTFGLGSDLVGSDGPVFLSAGTTYVSLGECTWNGSLVKFGRGEERPIVMDWRLEYVADVGSEPLEFSVYKNGFSGERLVQSVTTDVTTLSTDVLRTRFITTAKAGDTFQLFCKTDGTLVTISPTELKILVNTI